MPYIYLYENGARLRYSTNHTSKGLLVRISQKDLNATIEILNKESGSPLEHVPEHFYLDAAYGGYRLCRLKGPRNGAEDWSDRLPAKELHSVLCGMLKGIDLGKVAR